MNKQRLIQHYSKLYREAGNGTSEETNDQLAYKNILIALRNWETMKDVWACVAGVRAHCDNQDRNQIYETFLFDTHKTGKWGNVQ